ncbi:MAG: hypothetical protein V3R66_04615 [Rhodospirillales bacterium]
MNDIFILMGLITAFGAVLYFCWLLRSLVRRNEAYVKTMSDEIEAFISDAGASKEEQLLPALESQAEVTEPKKAEVVEVPQMEKSSHNNERSAKDFVPSQYREIAA